MKVFLDYLKYRTIYQHLSYSGYQDIVMETVRKIINNRRWRPIPDYIVRTDEMTNNSPDIKKMLYKVTRSNEMIVQNTNVTPESKIVLTNRTKLSMGDFNEYSPLIPGDVIFHNCALGMKLQKHFGIYVGGGYVVHLWSDSSEGGTVVVTTLKRFNPAAKVCFDRRVHVLDNNYVASKYKLLFFDRKQIIQRAVRDIGNYKYDLFSSNCQHWALKIATGKCMSISLRFGENKQLNAKSDMILIDRRNAISSKMRL